MPELLVNNPDLYLPAAFAGGISFCLVRVVDRPAYGVNAENGNHSSFRSAGPLSPVDEALPASSFL